MRCQATGNTIDVEMINGEDSKEINLELDESHKKEEDDN
jgi:hypothetical protein